LSSPPASTPSAVTLDHLIALNDEILALSRSGVPLAKGLADLGGDLPGRLGKIATAVSQRMEQGENLADVFADQHGAFPPIYRAVVDAGVRSGRLAVALEGLASSSRRVAELRRMVAMAMLYPLFVLLVACGLFIFIMPKLIPQMLDTYHAHGIPVGAAVSGLYWLVEYCEPWIRLLPWAAILLAVAWWLLSGRAMSAQSSRFARWTGFVPGLGRLLRSGRIATFSEVLALLVEQKVPVSEAVVLAANATGDPALQVSAEQLAQRIQRGETASGGPKRSGAIPPLIAWLIAGGCRHTELSTALRQSANAHHRRARHQADWLRMYLPLLLTLGIGGTATALYVLVLIGPWLKLLSEMGKLVMH